MYHKSSIKKNVIMQTCAAYRSGPFAGAAPLSRSSSCKLVEPSDDLLLYKVNKVKR